MRFCAILENWKYGDIVRSIEGLDDIKSEVDGFDKNREEAVAY